MSDAKTQSSLFDPPRAGSNLPEWSVGELSKLLKKTVEDSFGLVRVRGEISECKRHSSGHVYLTLKDDTAILASVCWKGNVSKLAVQPAVGMEIVATGRLTTYMGQSKYQLVIDTMALAGIGALLKMLEERKKKLAAEGLFDASRKKPLPLLPRVVGVITSPTGAVIRDILHRLADRFPRHVLLWPVAVQGEGAAAQIAAAIAGFNALPSDSPVPRPDVLIVARGGGSVEDMMPFNEENVVRAAAASRIPLISAVGHETDTTLIDYAADVRAPTPTAAAEMAVPVRDDLLTMLSAHGTRLDNAVRQALRARRDRLGLVAQALGDPARVLEPLLQRLDERSERLPLAVNNLLRNRSSKLAQWGGMLRHPRDVVRSGNDRLALMTTRITTAWREQTTRRQHRLEQMARSLAILSPKAVLGRGYALVQSEDGKLLTSAASAPAQSPIRLIFHDGERHGLIGE